jgi:hypothetical protein
MHRFVDLPSAADVELQPQLAASGFTPLESITNRVSFRRGQAVIQFEFYPEDPSPRPLNIAIGFVDPKGAMRGVGAWELIPESAAGRQYSTWRFEDQAGLIATLRRAYREVVDEWLRRYLDDASRLEEAIESSERVRQAEYDANNLQRLLRSARNAFDAGDYQAALDSYALADNALGPVDLKRREVAKRKLSQP